MNKTANRFQPVSKAQKKRRQQSGGITRRAFVISAAGGTAALLSPLARVAGANDDIRLGVIGLGVRGNQLIEGFTKVKGVRIAGLCDPDASRLAKVKDQFPAAQAVDDMRRLFDSSEIDAVLIATPNRWHSLAGIWAMRAGKDVYVEKPSSYSIWEGRKLVEASRKYDRIAQGGTQQRSDPMQVEVKEFLDSGVLGKVQFVRLNRFGVRQSIGKRESPLPIPEDVNYELWLGPGEDRPIYRENLQYDWHWDWNMGSGELGNWGPHVLDDCRHIAFRDRVTLPKRVVAGGGRFVWNDAGTTPNTHFVYYETDEIPVVMAVHNLPRHKGAERGDIYEKVKPIPGNPDGNRYQQREAQPFLVIHCENGYYCGSRGRGAAFSKEGKLLKAFYGDGGDAHAENFIAALRSRKRKDQNAEIEQTHFTAAWAHLGNISYRLGQSYDSRKAMERVKGYAPWEELIEGFEAHVRANEVDLASAGARIGPMLEIDVHSEKLIGPTATAEAKALLKPTNRAPYLIPEKL